MKLYNQKGYLNVPAVIEQKQTFNFIVGARGTGKTYGVLEYCYDNNILLLYMRRTQIACDTVCTNAMSIYKQFAEDRGIKIISESVAKNVYGFFEVLEDETKKLIAYGAALSTISNIRGAGLSDIKILFYDEFIPEDHVKPIKNEGDAFKNAYETINRNRELYGASPLVCICASNSDNIASPILASFNLIQVFADMQARRRYISINTNRGICAINMINSPVSKEKNKTALYKALSENDSYKSMAIENSFGDITKNVSSRPIKEYCPMVTVCKNGRQFTVYRHKSRNEYYASNIGNGPDRYICDRTGLECLYEDYSYLWDMYIHNALIFESVEIKVMFEDIFGKM